MPEMKPHLSSTVVTNIELFTGRTWLLPTFLTWYERKNKRHFLLNGDSGAGKRCDHLTKAIVCRNNPIQLTINISICDGQRGVL